MFVGARRRHVLLKFVVLVVVISLKLCVDLRGHGCEVSSAAFGVVAGPDEGYLW